MVVQDYPKSICCNDLGVFIKRKAKTIWYFKNGYYVKEGGIQSQERQERLHQSYNKYKESHPEKNLPEFPVEKSRPIAYRPIKFCPFCGKDL